MKELAPTIVVPAQADLLPFTIVSGQSLSAALDLGYQRAVRVGIPAVWTAANLTFQVSTDGNTFKDLYDATGAEYTVTVAANRAVILPLTDFAGIRFLKVRSGTAGAPVAQAATAALDLIIN